MGNTIWWTGAGRVAGGILIYGREISPGAAGRIRVHVAQAPRPRARSKIAASVEWGVRAKQAILLPGCPQSVSTM